MFGALKEWIERRRALREVRRVEGSGSKPFSAFFVERIALGRDAFSRGARAQAYEIWLDMHTQFPDLCMTSEKALNLLVDFGRYDEAEALLADARKRYPRHRAIFAAVSARNAFVHGDLEEGLRRAAVTRRQFPKVPEGYTVAVDCLTGLGRHAEAAEMIGRTARRFPHDFEIAVAYARNAEQSEDWPEALRRWGMVNKQFESFLGPLGMTQSLRELGRLAEARDLATQASQQFPAVPWFYDQLARIATAEGDLEDLARIWEAARLHCPDFARAYLDGAGVAKRLGQEAEAETILRLGAFRLRFDLDVHLEYARNAVRRGDRAEASARWAFVLERFPDCEEAREQRAAAQAAIAEQETTPHSTSKQP